MGGVDIDSIAILQDVDSTPFGKVRLYIEDGKVRVCGDDVSRIMEVAWKPCEGKCYSTLTFADVDDITRIAQDAGEPGVASYFVDWITRKVVPGVRQYNMYITDTSEEAVMKYTAEQEAALDIDDDWLNDPRLGALDITQHCDPPNLWRLISCLIRRS